MLLIDKTYSVITIHLISPWYLNTLNSSNRVQLHNSIQHAMMIFADTYTLYKIYKTQTIKIGQGAEKIAYLFAMISGTKYTSLELPTEQ